MEFSWEYSLRTEAEKIVFICSNIARGFYQSLNIYVLEHPQNNGILGTVYLPDLKFHTISNFWQVLRKNQYTTPVKTDPKFIKEIARRLKKYTLLTDHEIDEMKSQWQKKEDLFKKYSQNIFPDIYKSIKNIYIRPSLFGTSNNYSLISKDGNIYVCIRKDSDISRIARMIVLSIVHSSYFRGLKNEVEMVRNKSFFTKQKIGEFLLEKSSLAKIFPDLKHKKLTSTSSSLLKKSREYLRKLGFPQTRVLTIKKNIPYNKTNKKYLTFLTNSQVKVLKLLIQNRGKVVSFDKISETLWKQSVDKKYSLYAITRLISDIREKLRNNQIFTELIHTQRKKGYMLYD